MRISDWSSDVCSSDLEGVLPVEAQPPPVAFGQGPADVDVPAVGLDRAEVVEAVVEADDLAEVAAVVGGAGHRVCLDHAALERSEARRVGKECVSTFRSRLCPYPSKIKNTHSFN